MSDGGNVVCLLFVYFWGDEKKGAPGDVWASVHGASRYLVDLGKGQKEERGGEKYTK